MTRSPKPSVKQTSGVRILSRLRGPRSEEHTSELQSLPTRRSSDLVRQIFCRDHFGARAHDQIAKALGEANLWRAHLIAATRAPCGTPAIGGGVAVGKVNCSAFGAE